MGVEKYLLTSEKLKKIGNLDGALVMLHALEKYADSKKDYVLRDECRRRLRKYEYKLEDVQYDIESGAASPSNREPRSTELPKGEHQAFPVISASVSDPYRMAQVSDLYSKLTYLKLIDADQRDFIKNFTKGKTKKFIKWIGKKNILHFLVYEWKHRGYIPFEKSDEVWIIAANIFINCKRKVNNKPMPFYADDLRTTKNPDNITQDMENLVEILNPNNPSKNYNEEKDKEEMRVSYSINMREKKMGEIMNKKRNHDKK